jgi:uncharacterized protein
MLTNFALSLKPPYYAVIFSSQRSQADTAYDAMGERMGELAKAQPGYLGVESVRGADGFGLTVSYWDSEANIAAWKRNAEHRIAQETGQTTWYSHYETRVANVERAYSRRLSPNPPLKYLLIPGIFNSDAAHWQSLWEKSSSDFIRIEQKKWDEPVASDWVSSLEKHVSQLGENLIIVAHSLGTITLAQWASQTKLKIRGALIVSVPDPTGPAFPKQAHGFEHIPSTQLPFTSIMVSGTNDRFGEVLFRKNLAEQWGSEFVDIGAVGHINSDSGLGEWAYGRALLQTFK